MSCWDYRLMLRRQFDPTFGQRRPDYVVVDNHNVACTIWSFLPTQSTCLYALRPTSALHSCAPALGTVHCRLAILIRFTQKARRPYLSAITRPKMLRPKNSTLATREVSSCQQYDKQPYSPAASTTIPDKFKGTKNDQNDMVLLGKKQVLRRNFRFTTILGFASTGRSCKQVSTVVKFITH